MGPLGVQEIAFIFPAWRLFCFGPQETARTGEASGKGIGRVPTRAERILSTEAIIGIVSLLVTCPPSLFLLWRLVSRNSHHPPIPGKISPPTRLFQSKLTTSDVCTAQLYVGHACHGPYPCQFRIIDASERWVLSRASRLV